MSRNASRTATDSSPQTKPGLFSRGRDTARPQGRPGRPTRWRCPDCGLASHDPGAARLGFCTRCNEFTGMCGAGRRIVCPDVMTVTSWHTPCTNLGVVAWQVSQGAIVRVAVICPEHDRQLRAGNLGWIASAMPLAAVRQA